MLLFLLDKWWQQLDFYPSGVGVGGWDDAQGGREQLVNKDNWLVDAAEVFNYYICTVNK